jgi:hypothetical protein
MPKEKKQVAAAAPSTPTESVNAIVSLNGLVLAVDQLTSSSPRHCVRKVCPVGEPDHRLYVDDEICYA